MPRPIAIIAALEREVSLLVRHWQVSIRVHQGRSFKFFEDNGAVLVCGGIGAGAARRACEAAIVLYGPSRVLSAGFAGALRPEIEVGTVMVPRVVIDSGDGSRQENSNGKGVLVTSSAIAGLAEKRQLGRAYNADIVDMEAAAVARGAEAHAIPFLAIKSVSDPSAFVMPPLGDFVAQDGQFRSFRFALYAGVRPWLWRNVIQLARNSHRASAALCGALRQEILSGEGSPEHQTELTH